MSAKLQATTTKNGDTETRSFGWRILMGATNTIYAGCDALANAAADKYTGTFYAQNWTGADKKMTDEAKEWNGTGNLKSPDSDAKKAATEVALGTESKLANDESKVGKVTLLKDSAMTYSSDGLTFDCMVKFSHADADLSTNQVAWEYMSKTLTTASGKNAVVSQKPKAGDGTCKGKDLTPTVKWTTIAAGTAVGSTNTKNSGAASALTDITSGTHTVTTWTNAKVVFVNFGFQANLAAAVASGKKYQMATCTQFTATLWACGAMMAKGSAANKIEYVFDAYTGTAKPASLTADKEMSDATGLGKTATFTKVWSAASAASCTITCAQATDTSNNRVQAGWNWAAKDTENNLSTDFKQINGSFQYTNTEAADADATKVGTTAKDYSVAGAYCGVYSDVASKGKWADIKMTATITPSGASALSLAAAGLALAMAF